jgi:predicted DCC family thiol-disulfide oxidoreductase YuxK
MVIEICYPLSLFSRKLRVPLILGGVSLILGIRTLMGPTFEQFLIVNVFWIPWDRIGAWVRERLPRRTELMVLFDGACGLCRPTVAVLRRLDLRHRVEFLDVHGDWSAIAGRFPTLSQEQCLTEMHGIDPKGRVYVGFDTYRALGRVLPLGWIVLPLLYLPPVPWLGRRIYRAIAAGRHRTACALPLGPAVASSRSDTDRGTAGASPVS